MSCLWIAWRGVEAVEDISLVVVRRGGSGSGVM